MKRFQKEVRVSFQFREARKVFNARFAATWGHVVLDGETVCGDEAETAMYIALEVPGVDTEELT